MLPKDLTSTEVSPFLVLNGSGAVAMPHLPGMPEETKAVQMTIAHVGIEKHWGWGRGGDGHPSFGGEAPSPVGCRSRCRGGR